MKTFKSNVRFICVVASMQESVDVKTFILASHCADLANGPAEGDVSAFDLEREITSFVGFAFHRKLHGLSALDCLSQRYYRPIRSLIQPVSCSQNIDVSAGHSRVT